MDGSDDSDEDEQIGDKEPVFMVRVCTILVHDVAELLYHEGQSILYVLLQTIWQVESIIKLMKKSLRFIIILVLNL